MSNSYQENNEYHELIEFIKRQNAGRLNHPPSAFKKNQFINDETELNTDAQNKMENLRKEYIKIVSG